MVISVAKGLIERGHEACVVSMRGGAEDFYHLPDEMRRINLDLDRRAPTAAHSVWNTLLRVRALRRVFRTEKPEVVLSMLPVNNVLTGLSIVGLGIPFVLSERVYPEGERLPVRILQRLLYARATHFVTNSSGIDGYYHWIPQNKRKIIYNIPASVDREDGEVALHPTATRHIVSMGRFVMQKNFPLLLKAFAELSDEFPEWGLTIIGDGILFEETKFQVHEMGLQERVHLPGSISNPFPSLKAADIFAFPSNFEGLPNAVLEAMSCGLPVVTTDYWGEPRDLIREGVDGFIVPRDDVGGLTTALRDLMNDAKKRKTMGLNARQVLQRFTENEIIDEWEALLQSAANAS